MIWIFIKAIIFFSTAIALAVGFNLLKDTDGRLTIDFLNREYQLIDKYTGVIHGKP